MKRIPPSIRSLANRPTRFPTASFTNSLELTPLSREPSIVGADSPPIAPTGVPPTRSIATPAARAPAAPFNFSPRQLSERLDLSVVGQTKAKRILSVATYNHYIRVQAIRDSLAEQASETKSQLDRDDAFDTPYPSHNFSVFRDEVRSPTTSSPPRTKRPTPESTRTKGALLPRPLPTAPQEEQLAYMIQEKGMEGDLTADPEDAATRTSPKRSPIMTFENSYPPNSLPTAPRKRRPAVGVSLLPPDPTAYDSVPLPHETTKRKTTKQTAESSFESETLTDFPGQVSGTVRDEVLPWKAKLGDGDALIQDKSNVLILGPTGSGKTLLVKTLATFLDVPFAACEATGLTMAGYVGEDVESCVQRLLVSADWDVERASCGIIFIDEIDKLARSSSASYSKDVSGEGVQQALLKLLEGTVVSVPDKEGAAGGRSRKGPAKESHMVDTTNILFILAGAFVGLDKIVAERLSKGNSIGFTARLNKSGGVQDNLPATLKLEAENTKQRELLAQVEPTDLFRFGFIQEFIGRLPVIATLDPLSEADLLRVLTEPKNALVKQYQQLFKSSNVECRFTTPALREIAKAASGKGTGARGLRRIMESLLLDSQYEVPHSSVQYLLITRDVALGKSPALYYSRGQQSLFSADFDAEENAERVDESNNDEETFVKEVHRKEALRATG